MCIAQNGNVLSPGKRVLTKFSATFSLEFCFGENVGVFGGLLWTVSCHVLMYVCLGVKVTCVLVCFCDKCFTWPEISSLKAFHVLAYVW